jgi:hypothetical protein
MTLTPKLGRRLHLILMSFWTAQLFLVWFFPEDLRIPYLMLVSIYANVVGHWSGYSAERPVELVKDVVEDIEKTE